MILVICLAVLSGATLGHLGMPAIVQPAHLLAAALLFGLQFFIWMSFRHSCHGAPESRIAALKKNFYTLVQVCKKNNNSSEI